MVCATYTLKYVIFTYKNPKVCDLDQWKTKVCYFTQLKYLLQQEETLFQVKDIKSYLHHTEDTVS